MRILGLIPARKGSKGIPGKNKKLLGGKPLINYTFECAVGVDGLSKIVLSTDDEDIIEMVKSFNIEAPFLRPKELASDSAPTLGVIKHALDYYNNNGESYDAVCLLQPTCPFRTSDFVSRAISKFIKSGTDSLISVLKVPHSYNPHWVFKPDESGKLELFTGDDTIISRRQDLPTVYHRDGMVYITKADVLVNESSIFGKSIAYIESDPQLAVNIDTDEDWSVAEKLIRNRIT